MIEPTEADIGRAVFWDAGSSAYFGILRGIFHRSDGKTIAYVMTDERRMGNPWCRVPTDDTSAPNNANMVFDWREGGFAD